MINAKQIEATIVPIKKPLHELLGFMLGKLLNFIPLFFSTSFDHYFFYNLLQIFTIVIILTQ